MHNQTPDCLQVYLPWTMERDAYIPELKPPRAGTTTSLSEVLQSTASGLEPA